MHYVIFSSQPLFRVSVNVVLESKAELVNSRFNKCLEVTCGRASVEPKYPGSRVHALHHYPGLLVHWGHFRCRMPGGGEAMSLSLDLW